MQLVDCRPGHSLCPDSVGQWAADCLFRGLRGLARYRKGTECGQAPVCAPRCPRGHPRAVCGRHSR